MYWQIPVLCRIVIGYLISPMLIKRIATKPSRTRSLVWQYFFSASFALLAALIFGANLQDRRLLAVAVIGMFNAFACYCHWRAAAISLSRTSLFTQADDLICLALGYIVLGEGRFVGPVLAIGLALALGSVALFTYTSARATKLKLESEGKKGKIGFWVALYSVIWGISIFSMSYFSLKGVSLPSYMAAFYGGSLVGALFVFLLGGKKEAGVRLPLAQIVRGVAPLSLCIWLSLMTSYWARMLAPVTVVQPVFQVSEMIFPTLIGLWVFKEKRELTHQGWVAIALGLAGGLTLAFSF